MSVGLCSVGFKRAHVNLVLSLTSLGDVVGVVGAAFQIACQDLISLWQHESDAEVSLQIGAACAAAGFRCRRDAGIGRFPWHGG
jgi:hypothetical protein